MANQHKMVISVRPTRRAVNVTFRGHGNVLRLSLAGYNANIPDQNIPTTATQKEYVTAILNLVIANLS
jgi:hypothetical protein